MSAGNTAHNDYQTAESQPYRSVGEREAKREKCTKRQNESEIASWGTDRDTLTELNRQTVTH